MNCADGSVSGRTDGGIYTPFYYYGVPTWNFINYGIPSNEEYKNQGIDANATPQQNYHSRQPIYNRPRYAAPSQPHYGSSSGNRHYTNYNSNTYHNHFYQQGPHKRSPFRNGFVRPHYNRGYGQRWPRYSHNYGVVKKEHQGSFDGGNNNNKVENVQEDNKCDGVCVKVERLNVKSLDEGLKMELKKNLGTVEVKKPVEETVKKVVSKESGAVKRRSSSVSETLSRSSGKLDPKKKRSSLDVQKKSKPKEKTQKKRIQLAKIEDVPEVAHEEIIPFSDVKVEENRVGLNVDSDRETVKICESSDEESLHPPIRVSRRIYDSEEENSPKKPKKVCHDNTEAQTEQLKEADYDEIFRDIQAIVSPPKEKQTKENNNKTLLELLVEDREKNKDKLKDKIKEKPKKLNKKRYNELFGSDPEEETEEETPVQIHIANEEILFETDYVTTNFEITPTETHLAKIRFIPQLHNHKTTKKPDIYHTITKTQTKKTKKIFPVKCEECVDLTIEETIKTETDSDQKPLNEKISRTILPFLIVALDVDKKINYECTDAQLDLYHTNLKSVIEALFTTFIREDWPIIHDFKEIFNDLVKLLKECNVFESMEAMTAPFYKYLKMRDVGAPRSKFVDAFLDYLGMVWRKINYNPDVAKLTTEQRNILIYQIKMNNELIEKDLVRLRYEEMLRKNEEKRLADMSKLTQLYNTRLTMFKKQTNQLHQPQNQQMSLQSTKNQQMRVMQHQHQNQAQMQMIYQMQMQNNQRMVSAMQQMKKLGNQTSGGKVLEVNAMRAPSSGGTRNLVTSKPTVSSVGTFMPPNVTLQKPAEHKNQEKPSMSFRFDVESATLVPDTRFHCPKEKDNFKIKLPLKAPLRDFSKKIVNPLYENVTPPLESDSDSENLHIKEEMLASINMEKFGDKVVDLSWLDDLKTSENTQSKDRNSEDILKEISDAILKKNDSWINKMPEKTKKTPCTSNLTTFSSQPISDVPLLSFVQDTPPPDDADATDFYLLREPLCLCGKVAVFLCTNCWLVMYCSDECQKRHWPQHKKICVLQPKKDPNLSKK